MLNILKYEIKLHLKSLFIWGISLIVLAVLLMMFYPTFGDDVALVDKMLENYPKELLQAFGMGGQLSLATVPGYFSFVFVFLQLMLAIQASNYGFSILSVEERELTADYLMTKPVSRSEIYISKFLASVIIMIISSGIAIGASLISVEAFRNGHPYDQERMVLLLLTLLPLSLLFLSLSLFISTLLKKVKSVLSLSLGLCFGLYIVNSVQTIVGGKWVSGLIPFHYFEPNYILENGALNSNYFMMYFIIVVVSIIVSYKTYLTKDIHSV